MRFLISISIWFAAAGAPLACHAGFLSSPTGFISQIYAPINVNHVTFETPLAGGYQLEVMGPSLLNSSGTFEARGGMYGAVLPTVAYIAVKDGSSLRLTPGTATSPFDGNNVASMGFFGEAPHGINYTPYFPPIINGGMYLSLQYSLSGYLAPDSRLQFSSAVSVGNAFFSNAYGQLQSLVTLTDPGYFELNYQEVVPFNDGFRVDVPATGFYQMFYELHVTLDAKPGSGESWVVLDPGAGTGVQGSNLFPWLPDASPVPEPPSWLLSLTAIVGLPWLRRARRVRGEAAPLTAPSAISAAGGRADASSART